MGDPFARRASAPPRSSRQLPRRRPISAAGASVSLVIRVRSPEAAAAGASVPKSRRAPSRVRSRRAKTSRSAPSSISTVAVSPVTRRWTSRSSSSKRRGLTEMPKYCVATSSSWCASSMTATSHAGMTSPYAPCRTAASAQSRWWLTITMSDSAARCRMVVTKHSWYAGQSVPMQFSDVAAMSFQRGRSSGRSSTSARSPVSVCAAHSASGSSQRRSGDGSSASRASARAASKRWRQR